MWRNMLKTAGATAAYAVVHSALASRTAKRGASRVLGPSASDASYRAFYNAQSIATLAALVAYIRSLDDRELYEARGALRVALRSGQVAGLAGMLWTALHIGPGRMTGLDNLAAVAEGDAPDPMPEGHGPTPEPGCVFRATGPFRFSRHPMNVAMPLVLWCHPRMTANLLAFNLVSTAYLVAGSAIEERRLRSRFGAAYEAYRRSDVPFYLPTA